MSRAARQVAREMADCLEQTAVDWRGRAPRWILLLAPPIKRRRATEATRSRRATVKELDALCREVVFLRDGGKCRKCGRSDGLLDWSHVYSRRYTGTRWRLDNSMVLCRAHHMWWHHNPSEAIEWWRKEVGPTAAARLETAKCASTRADAGAVKLYLEAERKKYA